MKNLRSIKFILMLFALSALVVSCKIGDNDDGANKRVDKNFTLEGSGGS